MSNGALKCKLSEENISTVANILVATGFSGISSNGLVLRQEEAL